MRVAKRGGNWNNGSSDGLFALNVNNASSDANTNYGSRLLCHKQLRENAAPLGEKRLAGAELVGYSRKPRIITKEMKRVGYLYEEVIDIENCKRAILRASRGKRKRKHVRNILDNIDFYASELSQRIQSDDFLTPYTAKTIYDKSSNKEREILIPRFFPDQCAHHAVIQVISPYITKSSYY